MPTDQDERRLTFQKVELTAGGVEAHEVKAAGGPASAPFGRRLPRVQTLQHAALPCSVQAQNQNLPPLTLHFLLQTESDEYEYEYEMFYML